MDLWVGRNNRRDDPSTDDYSQAATVHCKSEGMMTMNALMMGYCWERERRDGQNFGEEDMKLLRTMMIGRNVYVLLQYRSLNSPAQDRWFRDREDNPPQDS